MSWGGKFKWNCGDAKVECIPDSNHKGSNKTQARCINFFFFFLTRNKDGMGC